MKHTLAYVLLAMLILSACAPAPTPTPAPETRVALLPTDTPAPTATSSPTPFPPPTGTFGCVGIERGVYAGVGELTLYPDGMLKFWDEGGRWMYNPDTRELTFQGNKYLASGIYDPDRNSLHVTLQPGVAISHAEDGRMHCELRR